MDDKQRIIEMINNINDEQILRYINILISDIYKDHGGNTDGLQERNY